jgi:hypothetical protein
VDERREDARDYVRSLVWSGEYDAEEVFIIVDEEVLDSDGENDAWLRQTISREFRKKREAERGWPKVTDCDRLDAMFEALHKRVILAEHRCGYTQQDALEVIDDVYKESGGVKSGFVGYCFYTLQDMEGGMWGNAGMYLGFGSFSRRAKAGIAVGQIILDAAEHAGFTVEWDGTMHRRLLLKGFRWQRRGSDQ